MMELNTKVIMEFTGENVVKVYEKSNKGTEIKYIDFNELVKCIISSYSEEEKNKIYTSPIFPHFGNVKTIQYLKTASDMEYVILLREAGKFDLVYLNQVFKNVGIPKLLFSIKLNKNTIESVRVVAVKAPIIKKDTELFYYPFGHDIGSKGEICLGANKLYKLDIQTHSKLHSIPDLILAMPNIHSYVKTTTKLEFRPVVESLIDKDFPDDWLCPLRCNYENWINSI